MASKIFQKCLDTIDQKYTSRKTINILKMFSLISMLNPDVPDKPEILKIKTN